MEFRTIKRTVKSKKKSKSRFICHISVWQQRRSTRVYLNTIKIKTLPLLITALGFILGERSEMKRSMMMENRWDCWCTYVRRFENHQLTNVCAVVTRHFGASVRSRWTHSGLCWQRCPSYQRHRSRPYKEQLGLRLTLSYSQYQELPNFLKAKQLQEQDTAFTDQVQTTIFVDKDDKDSVIESLIELFNGKLTLLSRIAESWVPISSS